MLHLVKLIKHILQAKERRSFPFLLFELSSFFFIEDSPKISTVKILWSSDRNEISGC
jgi:hypothetical protein